MTALAGQVALITGGGSGLGRALVDRFRAEGAEVAVLERSADKCTALAADTGGAVEIVEGDVGSLADNKAAISSAVRRFGRLDTLVLNAALWDYGSTLADLPEDAINAAFDELMAVNLKGPLFGARAALEALRATKGSITVTLSNAAFYPGGGGPLYTASKHALIGLVKQLAYELAPDVRVNGVAPGGMATDLRGPRALGQHDRSFSSAMPTERMLPHLNPLELLITPEDYTGAFVLFGSRRDGRATTGAIVNVDGGVGVRGRKQAMRQRAELMAQADEATA